MQHDKPMTLSVKDGADIDTRNSLIFKRHRKYGIEFINELKTHTFNIQRVKYFDLSCLVNEL